MDGFYNFVNYVEMVDEYFEEFYVAQISRKFIRNMEDKLYFIVFRCLYIYIFLRYHHRNT